MMLQTGEHLGPYDIIAQLGAGGMGEVYRAKDTRLKRDVAIKVVPEHLAKDRDALNRFEREAQAVAALSHPNILAIHDVGTEGETSFVVMELLEGETLRERLRGAALSWRKAAEIGGAIADGLAAAHSKGVIHRDLKPENIFLTSDGVVKILDFGLARMERPASPKHQPDLPTITIDTRPGAVMGTPAYMSPEQVRGEPADARSDIFAFGCVLYEMVTGNGVFARRTPADITAAILKEEPPEIAETAKGVPPELDRIIRHCLEKKPEDRFQSARDLAFDLKSVLSDTGLAKTPQALGARPPRASLWLATGAVVVALVALFVGLNPGGWRERLFVPSDSGSIDSLAILPFVNASNDPDTEYLSEGIPATIINSFSRLPHVRVVPWDTASRFKGREEPSSALGRELRVAAVLTGRILARGDNLTIQVELVNVAKDRHLWGDRYPRQLTDILEIEEDVAKRIAAALELELTAEDQTRLAKRYTESPGAHMAYIQGLFSLDKRTEEGFYKAIEYFQEAIQKDPTYALAYAGLADAYSLLSDWDMAGAADACPKARAAATRALELDNDLAEAYAVLAAIQRRYDWDFSQAETTYKKAIALKPGYASAHHRYAIFLAEQGRMHEAKQAIGRAQELDPLSLIINTNAAYVHYMAREYDRAIEACQKALDLDRGFRAAYYWMADAHAQQGAHEQAIATLEKAAGLVGRTPECVAKLGRVYATAGMENEARTMLKELNDMRQRTYVPPISLANVYAALGERDNAFEWFERAYDQRNDDLLELKMNAFYDPFRGDPRFDDLLRRIGFEPDSEPQSTREARVARPTDGKIRLAVLPFDDLSPEPQEWFSDGMTEEMITQLGRLQPKKLGVIARTSAMHYKGKDKKIDQIGRELGVQYLVEGSVRRYGDNLRVIAKLIRASDQTHIWSEDFNRTTSDLLVIQSDVARQVARVLAIELLPRERDRLAVTPTVIPEAHEAYLKGRYYFWKFSEEDCTKAVDYFQRALEHDPDYALAFAGLADAYWQLAHPLWALPPAEAMPKARAAARKALELDETLSEAHVSLGLVAMFYDWDFAGALREFQRAIELSPSHSFAYCNYAACLLASGRSDDAIAAARRAQQHDPFNTHILASLGEWLWAARRYEEAKRHLYGVLEADPSFQGLAPLAWAHEQCGEYEKAILVYQRGGRLSEEETSSFRAALAAQGPRGYWRRWLKKLDADSLHTRVSASQRAAVHAALDEKDRAFEWLERAYRNREGFLPLLNANPKMDPLRPDPRFAELLQRIGIGAPGIHGAAPARGPGDKIKLAVLPFENLGPAEDEYFADGISDEIRSRLAAVGKLGVISRASAFQCKHMRDRRGQVATELNVDYLIDGTIRWSRDEESTGRVRITPELIRTSDEMVLWSKPYDRVIEDIFDVQSDIAGQVIKQLQITLLEPERRAIEVVPTESSDAYNAYLRGLHYAGRLDSLEENHRLAIQMFERAASLDPDFALAYAQLSIAHSIIHHGGHDPTEVRASKAKAAVDQAFDLQPVLPEAYLALGWYHYGCRRDYESALEALTTAEKGLPNRAKILELAGFIRRRQGRFEASLDNLKRAFELDPLSADLATDIAHTYIFLRRYQQAERWYDRSISLAPDQNDGYLWKSSIYWLWHGDTERARATLEEMPTRPGGGPLWPWFRQELYERNYERALNRLTSASVDRQVNQTWFIPTAQLTGLVYRLIGEPERARSSYESARALLETALREQPDDHRVHSSLGIVYAGLGRKEEAIREGRLGVELFPVSKDAMLGPARIEDLAFIYVLVGEYEAALDQIEHLLSIPSRFSLPLLRLDPRWDPLRDHPRYAELLKRHGSQP